MERLVKQLIACSALAVGLALPAAGAEVQLTPGADVQKALDGAAPGDTIVLGDGVYYQRLTIARGGTPGKPVTLKAANGGGATISGAVPPGQAKLTFELAAGESDIYKAPVPQRAWWVMADGRNLVNYGYYSYLKQSQFPNQSSGALKRCTPDGFAWRNGHLYVRLPGGAEPSTANIEFSCPTGFHTSAEPEFAEETRWAPDTGFDGSYTTRSSSRKVSSSGSPKT